MKRHLRCVISAAVAVLLIIGTIDYTLQIGKETKIVYKPVQEAVQSDVIVQDFIHDNYVISERNPWTDYNLHPMEYSDTENSNNFKDQINAQAAILVDVDSKTIMYGKNIDEKMYPASTTKLMTALTVLQTMSTSDVVTIGDEVSMIAPDSSKAGFSKGQVVTVEELLEGLLISSGNDAAYILAKATGQAILENNIANEGKKFTSAQCVQRFIFEMNKNVRDMNLENTNFTSPDGYDDKEQYTTASDLSKIAIEAYSNDTIMKICKLKNKYSKTLNKTWKSTNELINESGKYYYKYCLGMKTGSTDLAGKCLVSAAKKGDTTCISVVLNDETDEQRWKDSQKLLNYGLK
ncbi:MAG: D-alanyl-D-alanine carboxypeptidase family protein [Eubacterium sp.]